MKINQSFVILLGLLLFRGTIATAQQELPLYPARIPGSRLYQAADNPAPIPFSAARWISPGFAEDSLQRPCPVFSKSFVLDKRVRRAALNITALGLYEADINGKKAGDGYFTPGFTSYGKRLQYQIYDVSTMLRKGENNIQVTVADGWYRGVFGGRMKNNNYGKEGALLFELNLTYSDGSSQSIVSDQSWQCGTGMIRYTDFYQGELQDTRMGLNSLTPVKLTAFSKDHLVPTLAEPVKKQKAFHPVKIWYTPKGEQVLDFGQNMAGWVALKIKGQAGDTVRIGHAEMVDPEGNFYTENLRGAKAEDVYVLNGETQELEPHFTYHGFRYVRINGFKATKTNCSAIAVHTDLPPAGTFSCSNRLINRLQQNILWSMSSNFIDIPTDCPQRSERLGWTGDAQVFCKTAALNKGVLDFYSKYLMDLAADQGSNGGVPSIIPDLYGHQNPGAKNGAAGWGDAATIIPWTLYEMYGDTAVLKRQYASMKAWVDYLTSQSSDHLWKANGYGDWYAMGDSTSIPFIDQCFYIHSTSILIRAAQVLNRKQDVATYTSLKEKIKQTFLDVYGKFDTRATSTQTAYVLALAFELLPEHQRSQVAALLAAKIRENGNKLATGFLGTPYLLPVLSRFGYSDLAYTLLLQQECPSWLYPVTKGATTIWEKWDAVRPDGILQETSFNHFSYGAVGQWLYEHIGGITALEPGYRKIRIKPETGGGLHWAKASYICPYGKISSEWKLKGGQLILKVVIPAGASAIVLLPGKKEQEIGAGKHQFKGKV